MPDTLMPDTLMPDTLTVILVSTGVFQDYIIYNIKQLLYFKYNIIIITDKKYFGKLNEIENIQNLKNIKLIDSDELYTNFDIKSNLDKHFRDGFWHNTSKRLFLVYNCMKKYNLENCIHLENDVLIYYAFSKNDFNKNNIYITNDAENRCIPGIIYIPNYKLLNNLIEYYNYDKNDMENMSIFYNNNKDICTTLPIIKQNKYYDKIDIYNENYKIFKGIFDGAAIGQYLGGVDPRNISGDTTGFINETCVVKYNHYKFIWIKNDDGYSLPYINIIIDDDDKNMNMNMHMHIPIYNLHIHSKNLKKFTIFNTNI